MIKRLLVTSAIVMILAGSLITQTSFTETPQKQKVALENEAQEIKEYRDPWQLKSQQKERVREEIVSWVNDHFGLSAGAKFGDVKDVVTPTLPLKFVKRVEFDVTPIPEWRRATGYEELQAPTYHAVYLLRDSRGDLYNVVVESYDKEPENFTVHSVGPVLDHSPEANKRSVDMRRMKTWPSENIAMRPSEAKGKPVLVPYPYSMNQYFFQYGEDPSTATFISMNSGNVYQGLESILTDVDVAWQNVH